MTGMISSIKHFAAHDGPGIRTTVFFKGCPLKCVWCHNPESIAFAPQMGFYGEKCIDCGICQTVCPQNAFHGQAKNKDMCQTCNLCETACDSEALHFYGRPLTVEQVMEQVLKDRQFYETSGGGVTLSGGECLCQPEFCARLLQTLKKENIHTAVDTCGFVPRQALDLVLPYADVFLYDIKAIDEDVHIRCTGQSNRQILDNLRYLDKQGKQIWVRVPFVPGYNDREIPKIREFLDTLSNVTKAELLPYHNFAGSKYAALGMPNTLPDRLPTREEIQQAEAILYK